MPQMSPMNWTILFTMFVVIYLITKALTYFFYTPNYQSKEKVQLNSPYMANLNNKLNWKW